ncbi:MAG: hypothetical protein HN919_11835 [Verrucomicrobia bacterium]|jgi:hypothetical protein|nr:hypothetical protein [Verrucomicrobiota bacterium]MBT7066987.1 hypothetical protein [Verrucomicrobiota bacterium]MBT7699982.1 hypothetical protein [Verrucomicrobiota bacterium]
MKVALLINDRESRAALARSIEAKGGRADEYPTAAKAAGMFGATRYDLILIHWQVYPGLKPSDPSLKELAAMIPVVSMNRNILYWETALRVIDIIRMADSPNRTTPLMVIFPALGTSTFEAGDRLARESVESDLADRQPATVVTETLREEIIAIVEQQLTTAKT